MRQNEFVADEYAMKLGFGYELAYSLDHELYSIPRNGFLNALFDPHPSSDDRIAALQNLGVNYSRYWQKGCQHKKQAEWIPFT